MRRHRGALKTFQAHAPSHGVNGTDPIYITDLAGILAHTSLSALDWAGCGHTGPADRLAGFDSGGATLSYRIEGTGGVASFKKRTIQSVAPTVNDDFNAGYAPFSFIIDDTGPSIYMCVDATNGAAVWVAI